MTHPLSVRVEFFLASPLILTKPVHLDGILLALADERRGGKFMPGDTPIDPKEIPICLDEESGIFRCSQLLLDGDPPRMQVTTTKSIWHPTEFDGISALVDNIGSYSKSWEFGKRGPLKNVIGKEWAIDASLGYFLAETDDLSALTDAVKEIPALGKWSKKGYGAVESVDVSVVSGGDPWVLSNGQPSRALPLDLWNKRYGGDCGRDVANVRAPYFHPDTREICAVSLGGLF